MRHHAQPFSLKVYLFHVHYCFAYMRICAPQTQCSLRPEENVRSSATGITESCYPPHQVLRTKARSFATAASSLTAKPPLQPSVIYFAYLSPRNLSACWLIKAEDLLQLTVHSTRNQAPLQVKVKPPQPHSSSQPWWYKGIQPSLGNLFPLCSQNMNDGKKKISSQNDQNCHTKLSS